MKLGSRGLREKKEAERRKYAAAMEKKHAQERAEIATLEMLLDAHWYSAHKVFARYRLAEGPPYWRYWDRTGKELPRDPQRGWPKVEDDD